MNKNSIPNLLSKLYYFIIIALTVVFFSMFTILLNWGYLALSIALIALLYICFRKYNSSLMKLSLPRYIPFIIFLVTFISRLSYCTYVSSHMHQISDFGATLEAAARGDFANHKSYYPVCLHKFFYTYLLNILHITTQYKVFIFQSFCVSLVSVLIYKIGINIKNEKLGLLAAIVYICWPSNIIYSTIIVEDHMAALLVCIIIYLLFNAYDTITKENAMNSILWKSSLLGILLGSISFFKDWGLVIITASIICSIYLFFTFNKAQKKYLLLCLLLIFVFRFATEKCFIMHADNVLDTKTKNNVIYGQLFAALDPNSDGGNNPELYNEYDRIQQKTSEEYPDTTASEVIISRLLDNFSSLPMFFAKKGRNAYEDDVVMINLATKDSLEESFYSKNETFFNIVTFISRIYYMTLVIGIMMSALLVRNKKIFFLNLCIIGGIFVSFLVESQSRYKYAIETIWTFPVVYGLYMLYQFIQNYFSKHFKNQ